MEAVISPGGDAKAKAAAEWFGYGRWGAPFWFVGKEPGGTDEPEQYASWLRLGGSELIDCRAHDLDCAESEDSMMWHGRGGRLQPTWRPLIALLLAYQGASEYDKDAVWRYQDERWGSATGETALVELSAVAAPSTSAEEDSAADASARAHRYDPGAHREASAEACAVLRRRPRPDFWQAIHREMERNRRRATRVERHCAARRDGVRRDAASDRPWAHERVLDRFLGRRLASAAL